MSLTEYVRDAIAEARQDILEWTRETVRQSLANLLTSTTIARASESDDDPLVHDVELWGSVDGYSTTNAEGGERARPRARHVEAPCFAYVPLEGEPVKVVGLGANLLAWAAASTRYRPKGVRKGEFAIHNLRAGAQQLVIKGDKDSALTVDVGSFRHVEVNKDGEIELTSRVGAKVTMNTAGEIILESPSGARVRLGQTTLATTLLEATHFGGNFAAPPPIVTPGAALNGGVATGVGTDAALLVSMVVNAPGGLSGTLCSITFGTPYDSPPQFSITAASVVLIAAGVVPVGMGAVRGQATAVGLDIITDLPIATGPLLLSVMLRQ